MIFTQIRKAEGIVSRVKQRTTTKTVVAQQLVGEADHVLTICQALRVLPEKALSLPIQTVANQEATAPTPHQFLGHDGIVRKQKNRMPQRWNTQGSECTA